MKKSNLALATAITGVIALGSTLAAAPVEAAGKEKCYGISKAGENDCATKTSSCAGSSKVDFAKDAFKVVVKGKCLEMGGSLESA